MPRHAKPSPLVLLPAAQTLHWRNPQLHVAGEEVCPSHTTNELTELSQLVCLTPAPRSPVTLPTQGLPSRQSGCRRCGVMARPLQGSVKVARVPPKTPAQGQMPVLLVCAGCKLLPRMWMPCSQDSSPGGSSWTWQHQSIPARGSWEPAGTPNTPSTHSCLIHRIGFGSTSKVHRDDLALDSTVSTRIESIPPNMLLFSLQAFLQTPNRRRPKQNS